MNTKRMVVTGHFETQRFQISSLKKSGRSQTKPNRNSIVKAQRTSLSKSTYDLSGAKVVTLVDELGQRVAGEQQNDQQVRFVHHFGELRTDVSNDLSAEKSHS